MEDYITLSLKRLSTKMSTLLPHTGELALSDEVRIVRAKATCKELSWSAPSWCMVLSGSKEWSLGQHTLTMSAGSLTFTTLHLPAVSTDAAKQDYVAVYLSEYSAYGTKVLEHIQARMGQCEPLDESLGIVMPWGQSVVNASQLNALERLIDWYAQDRADELLYELYIQELYYWVLLDKALRAPWEHFIIRGSNALFNTVNFMASHYQDKEALSISVLAARAGLSVPAFYMAFKELTSMTPLQYLKYLRLLKARKLLQTGEYKAYQAAAAVGYVSAPHFCRDYRKLFLYSPKHDCARLKNT